MEEMKVWIGRHEESLESDRGRVLAEHRFFALDQVSLELLDGIGLAWGDAGDEEQEAVSAALLHSQGCSDGC